MSLILYHILKVGSFQKLVFLRNKVVKYYQLYLTINFDLKITHGISVKGQKREGCGQFGEEKKDKSVRGCEYHRFKLCETV